MRTFVRLLTAVHIGLLATVAAIPAQAAVHVGAPTTSSGSVATLTFFKPVTLNPVGGAAGQLSIALPGLTPGSMAFAANPGLTSGQSPTRTSTTVALINQSSPLGQSAQNGSVVSLSRLASNYAAFAGNPGTPAGGATISPQPPAAAATGPVGAGVPAIQPATALTADEQNMVDMVNQERAAAGVRPLQVDLRLAAVARAKAADMKANNYFGHTSPTYGSPWAMMQQVGLIVKWAGENIGGNKSVAGAMAAWMSDPGHRANILDPRFTHVGVGIVYGSAYGNLYVQEFLQE